MALGRAQIKPGIKLFLWSSLFSAWWWFVDTLFFVSVGVSCGYVIANPVLCCAVFPASCALAYYVGVYGLLALYCLAVGGSVAWWVFNSRASGVCALGALLLLLAGALQETFVGQEVTLTDQRLTEPWDHICAFKPSDKEEGVLQTALTLQEQFLAGCGQTQCEKQRQKNLIAPDLIIGPESCLSCALNREPSLCALFDNVGSCLSPLVILGARREADQDGCKSVESFNSLFMLHQGRIIFCYDKKFPLPFLETFSHAPLFFTCLQGFFSLKQKLCRWLSIEYFTIKDTLFGDKPIEDCEIEDHSIRDHSIGDRDSKNFSVKNYPSMPLDKNLFFSRGKTPYALGTGSNEITLTLGGVTYQTHCALCSDFFCTNLFLPQQSEKNPLMIVLVNDAWFYGDSVASRMHRYAVLWAVRYHTPVLYVGYKYASWIEPSGRDWSLAALGS